MVAKRKKSKRSLNNYEKLKKYIKKLENGRTKTNRQKCN